MLRFLVAISIIGAVVSGPIDPDDPNELSCAEETGSTVPAYQNYYTHRIFDNSDRKLKCMVMCTLSKAHLITEDGDLDAEKAADHVMVKMDDPDIDRETVVTKLNGCDYSIGDQCDKGFAIGQCILDF